MSTDTRDEHQVAAEAAYTYLLNAEPRAPVGDADKPGRWAVRVLVEVRCSKCGKVGGRVYASPRGPLFVGVRKRVMTEETSMTHKKSPIRDTVGGFVLLDWPDLELPLVSWCRRHGDLPTDRYPVAKKVNEAKATTHKAVLTMLPTTVQAV